MIFFTTLQMADMVEIHFLDIQKKNLKNIVIVYVEKTTLFMEKNTQKKQ